MDPVTVRRVGNVCSFGLLAPILAWMLPMTGVTFSRQGYWAAAALGLVSVVIIIVIKVVELHALARLKKYGRTTEAIIIEVEERYVSGHTYHQWWTRVKVSYDFYDCAIHAEYTQRGRAEGKGEGQSTLIVYDPKDPTSVSSAQTLSRLYDRYVLLSEEGFILGFFILVFSWLLVHVVHQALS